MLTSSQNFGLVSFGQDLVAASTYVQLEKVYLDSIGITARTETNEILYWRDRYNEEFRKTGDRLFVYGLTKDKEAIGFALVFYFKMQKLLVVDHIAVGELDRHFGAFFYFKELIAQHVTAEGLQVDYVLAEIVTSKEGDPHPVEPHLLIELLKQRGFKVVKMTYYTPSIKESEYQHRLETTLMLMRHDRGDRIASGTMLSLLKTLLFDLYQRWYTPHSKDIKGFRKQLNDLYAIYREQLASTDTVELNGSVHSSGVLPIALSPTRPTAPVHPVMASLAVLLALVGLSAGLIFLLRWSGLPTISVLTTFIVALTAFLVLLAVWYKPAGKQADKVLNLLNGLLRRNKDVR